MEDTMKKMYQLNQLISDLQAKLDDGEIDIDTFADTKESLIEANTSNFESLANWHRKNVNRINERAEAIKDLQAQKKHFEAVNNQIERIMGNMLHSLDVKKYTAGLNSISMRPSHRLVIDDITKLPDEFFKSDPKPDYKGIKDAIKDGEDIPGASIQDFENVNIK